MSASNKASLVPAAKKPPGRTWLYIAIALTVLKLWLTRGQPIFAIGPAAIDDRLFLRLANSILDGDWLGQYDNLTLAKGPFYPLWVAFVFLTGLPLRLAEQLAYIGAAIFLVNALSPHLKSRWSQVIAYLMLIWNPMTYEMETLGRILRQNIYTTNALIIFALTITLYNRRSDPGRRVYPCAIALGLSFGCFWLTREESIWMLPSCIILLSAIVLGSWITSRLKEFKKMLTASGLAVVFALVPILIVSSLNLHYYGWFGTVEYRAKEFNDAYGALLRVKVGPEIPFVPVPRQTREAIYPFSPTFSKVKPHLEGETGRVWSKICEWITHLPPEELQMAGGWFMWALRDTVTAAGHTHNAGEAMAFYRQMAVEINAACDDGRLQAGPRRSGFLPPWKEGQTMSLLKTWGEFTSFFVTFKGFNAITPPSMGNDDLLTLFRDLTGERTSISPDGVFKLPRQHQLGEWKSKKLQSIGLYVSKLYTGLIALAHLGLIYQLAMLIVKRRATYLFWVALSAWGACAACLLINALVHLTSFPTLTSGSFAPAYPLAILFIIAVAADLGERLRSRSA